MQPTPFHSGKLAGRRARNASLRAIGEEPLPGFPYVGVKRLARWLGRIPAIPVRIKWPRQLVYMHSAAKRQSGFIEDLS